MKQKPKQKPDAKKAQSEMARLKERIELLQKEKEEIFAKLQRVSADYSNFQKRVPKQIADSIAYEKEKIIKVLLPVLDNFEHTLAGSHSSENVETVVKGVQIIYDQMLDILKSQGIEQINAMDKEFDPALHQAVMRKQDAEKEDGVVLEEFQKGYRLNGRLIRPSKVAVNKPLEEKTAPDGHSQQPPEAGMEQNRRKNELSEENH